MTLTQRGTLSWCSESAVLELENQKLNWAQRAIWFTVSHEKLISDKPGEEKKKCNSKSKLFISVAPESSAQTQDLVNWLLPETAPRRPGPRSCRAERRELADSHVSEREICRKTNMEFAHFPPLGPIIARLVWQIMQLLPQLNKLVFIFDIPRAPGDCFVYI